jgi:transcriptional regulator with XRE-family HTH domain
VGDIERGTRNPALLSLEKIAEALGKPIRNLFNTAQTHTPNIILEKPTRYLSPEMDKTLLTLIKSLRKNSEKDQAYILKSAKAMSTRLKKSH